MKISAFPKPLDTGPLHHIQEQQQAKPTPEFHRSHISTLQKMQHSKIKGLQAFTKRLCKANKENTGQKVVTFNPRTVKTQMVPAQEKNPEDASSAC